LAINEFNYNWFLNNTKFKFSNVIYIPNFPFLKKFEVCKVPDLINIVHVANLHHPKDHFTHVLAISKLVNNLSVNDKNKIFVKFIGNFSDSNYVNDLKSLIIKLNLSEVISLIGPANNIAEELIQADIGVLSSASEGLPLALLEYGLAGLPVVVTEVGDCPTVVNFGEFGKIIKVGDFDELYKGLEFFIKNRDIGILMGDGLRKHIELNYGSEMFYNKYLNAIS
jgi:glycosyltransferase involved in cell wall biosynthesis